MYNQTLFLKKMSNQSKFNKVKKFRITNIVEQSIKL